MHQGSNLNFFSIYPIYMISLYVLCSCLSSLFFFLLFFHINVNSLPPWSSSLTVVLCFIQTFTVTFVGYFTRSQLAESKHRNPRVIGAGNDEMRLNPGWNTMEYKDKGQSQPGWRKQRSRIKGGIKFISGPQKWRSVD